MLAHDTATKLFPYEDPINQTIKLGADYYTVVGVTQERESEQAGASKISSSLASQDFNKDVYIPLNTCRLRFGERIIDSRSGSRQAEETQLTQITIQVGSMEEVLPTVPADRSRLRALPPQERRREDRALRPALAGPEAGPSVRDHPGHHRGDLAPGRRHRHHEHHARDRDRADPRDRHPPRLGRKRRDITQQFLIETVVLSGVGGLAGRCASGSRFPGSSSSSSTIRKRSSPGPRSALAFGISVAIGILFGIYPARRAALMDPIEALRHE